MARKLIPVWLLTLAFAPACFNTCALDLNEGVGLPCDNDEACPTGTHCGEDGTCQAGDPQDAALGDALGSVDATNVDAQQGDSGASDASLSDLLSADVTAADTAFADVAPMDSTMADGVSADSAALDAGGSDGAAGGDASAADSAAEDAWGEDGAFADSALAVDAAALDTGTADASTADAWEADAGALDVSVEDSGVEDASLEDTGVDAAGQEDAGLEDAGAEDSGDEDGWSCPMPGYTLSPDSGAVIGATAALTITFDEPIETGTLTLAGGMASEADSAVWSGDTEVTLAPSLVWSAGAQTLTIEVHSACGQLVSIAASYEVKHVLPLYPTSGADWNDYLLNDGGDLVSASDAACQGDETGGYTACLHGGELRLIEVPNATGCADLSASDALGAFEWICAEDVGGGAPYFLSTGLAASASARHLVDFDSVEWRDNWVIVEENASTLYQTDPEVWWGNDVRSFVSSASMVEGGVHLMAEDTDAALSTNHDKVTVLIAEGATLRYQPGSGSQAVVWLGTHSFLWLEGDIDATGDMYGIHLVSTSFSVVRNVSILGGTNALRLNQSHNNRVSDVRVVSTLQSGVYLNESHGNLLERVSKSGDGGDSCFTLDSSDGNQLRQVRVANCQNGFILGDSEDNVVQQLHVSNCDSAAILISADADRNTLVGLTVDSSYRGLRVDGNSADDNVFACVTAANCETGVTLGSTSSELHSNLFQSVAAVNLDGNGIYTSGAQLGSEVVHFAAAEGQSHAAYLLSATPTHFHGLLKLGLGCHTFSSDRGLFGDCSPGAGSTATLTTGVSMADTFLAKVSVDDSANQADISGAASYDTLDDWLAFDDPQRGWCLDGVGAFPALDQVGVGASGDGMRIYDWRLSDSDTGDGGDPAVLDVLLESDTDVITHTWSDGSTSTFVINAVEQLFDGVGNDNGLCESDEVCVYTPNIGAYQGHGALVDATFTPGSVTGVVLYKRAQNGVAP